MRESLWSFAMHVCLYVKSCLPLMHVSFAMHVLLASLTPAHGLANISAESREGESRRKAESRREAESREKKRREVEEEEKRSRERLGELEKSRELESVTAPPFSFAER